MLELIHVVKQYKKQIVVDDLSFSVGPGEILGLIGPNGAGKSTTVSMIATLVSPTKGKIIFDGMDITTQKRQVRNSIGYVPQDVALYESLTGIQNLDFWADAYHLSGEDKKKRITEVCEMIGFTNEILNKKVKLYSGGMKRRLNIGVALLHHPKLVILDEPTVGIDVFSRKQILKAIHTLKEQGTSVIYIGHYMEEAEQLCDRVVFMEHGKCVLSGKLDELLGSGKEKQTLEQLYERLSRKIIV